MGLEIDGVWHQRINVELTFLARKKGDVIHYPFSIKKYRKKIREQCADSGITIFEETSSSIVVSREDASMLILTYPRHY